MAGTDFQNSEMPPSGRSVAQTEDGKSRDDRNRADVASVTAGETAPLLILAGAVPGRGLSVGPSGGRQQSGGCANDPPSRRR